MTTENQAAAGQAGQPAGSPAGNTQPGRQDAGGTTYDAAQTQRNAPAQPERADSMSAAEIRAEATRLRNDPKSALWNGTGEEHDHAVAVSFKAHELDAQAAGEQGEELSPTMRLSNRALDINAVLEMPSVRIDQKQFDADPDAQNFMKYVDNENIASPVVSKMIRAYVDALSAGKGQISEQSIAQMERDFAGQLHPQQVAKLKDWIRRELNVNLARHRRGR